MTHYLAFRLSTIIVSLQRKKISMLVIGLIREGKIPEDNRVALTPSQCRWLLKNTDFKIVAQPSEKRCFSDREYVQSGVEVKEDLSEAGLLLGIKEVPVDMLLPEKT